MADTYLTAAQFREALGLTDSEVDGVGARRMGTTSPTHCTFYAYLAGRRVEGLLWGAVPAVVEAARARGLRLAVHETDALGFGEHHYVG